MSQWDLIKEDEEDEGPVKPAGKKVIQLPNREEFEQFCLQYLGKLPGSVKSEDLLREELALYLQAKIAQASVLEVQLKLDAQNRDVQKEPSAPKRGDDPTGLEGADLEYWLKKNPDVVVNCVQVDKPHKVYFNGEDRFLYASLEENDPTWWSVGSISTRHYICQGFHYNQGRVKK